MGIAVHYEDITKDTMLSAINAMLAPEVMANAKKVSHSFQNRIQTPLETAIWWVEHVAATGGAPLTRSYSVDMTAIEYYSWDVLAVLVAGFTVLLSAWAWFVWQCCCSAAAKTKSKSAEQRKLKKNK